MTYAVFISRANFKPWSPGNLFQTYCNCFVVRFPAGQPEPSVFRTILDFMTSSCSSKDAYFLWIRTFKMSSWLLDLPDELFDRHTRRQTYSNSYWAPNVLSGRRDRRITSASMWIASSLFKVVSQFHATKSVVAALMRRNFFVSPAGPCSFRFLLETYCLNKKELKWYHRRERQCLL